MSYKLELICRRCVGPDKHKHVLNTFVNGYFVKKKSDSYEQTTNHQCAYFNVMGRQPIKLGLM